MNKAENDGNHDDEQNFDDQQDQNTEDETSGDEVEQDGQDDGGDAQGDQDDEVVITVGEEAPPQQEEDHQPAPQWVKDLRKADKEKAREIRELRAQLAQKQTTTETAAPAKLTKPTLADCDYDEDAFESKLVEYNAQQQRAQAEQQKAEDARKAADAAWAANVQGHETKKSALKVADLDECEDRAKEILSITQQGIIIAGAKNSAIVLYAIGKNPEKAKEFAAITDPVKFCFAIAQWEPELKVTPRKTPPPPERSVRGGTTPPITNDVALKRLEDEADRTGNRTKVIQYKKQLEAKNASKSAKT